MSSIILEAKSLTKEYKQTLALDHINLQIKKGKIYGFIGQNGAGKTTFLRLVTGLAFPTSGTLSLWVKVLKTLYSRTKRRGSMTSMDKKYQMLLEHALSSEMNYVLGISAGEMTELIKKSE